jgi:glycosyltransferase involved in cell wall biosynthesis
MNRGYSVLQVIDRLGVGGAERIAVDLSNILHERGVSVGVLTICDEGELAQYLDSAIPFTSLHRPFRLDPRTLLKAHLNFKKYDLIHVHLKYNFVYVGLVKWLFRGSYKVLVHDHDNLSIATIPPGLKWFLRLNPHYVCVSRAMVEWARRNLALDDNSCWLLPNIVRRRKPIQRHGGDGFIRLVLVSNIKPEKNIGFAIELMSALMSQNSSIHLDIIGRPVDPEYLTELQKRLHDFQVSSRVRFLTDITDVQTVLPEYDLALHTSQNESGPLALIEYMAALVPFVAYEAGEVANQLKAHIPRVFLNTLNKEEWVARIVEMLASREQYRREFDRIFEQLYSEEMYYASCMKIYGAALSSR